MLEADMRSPARLRGISQVTKRLRLAPPRVLAYPMSFSATLLGGESSSSSSSSQESDSAADAASRLPESMETETCQAQYEWQTSAKPTCNSVHEQLNLATMYKENWLGVKKSRVKLIANGFWSDIWMLNGILDDTLTTDTIQFGQQQQLNMSTTPVFTSKRFVAKTLRYTHEYLSLRNYDRNRRDAMAMERLSQSPHIIDMYAYCSVAQLVEYADGGDLNDALRLKRAWGIRHHQQQQQQLAAQQQQQAISSSVLVQQAVAPTVGAAVVAAMDESAVVLSPGVTVVDGAAAVTTNDLPEAAVAEDVLDSSLSSFGYSPVEKLRLATQAIMALADLHNVDKEGQASMAHTDIGSGQFVFVNGRLKLNDFNRARFISSYKNDTSQNCPYFVARNPGKWRSPEEYRYDPQTEKVDVYSFGNILYVLLQEERPFHDETSDDVREQVINGTRPTMYDDVWNSPDPIVQILKQAMVLCHVHDPKQRPGAREIEVLLKDAMRRYDPGTLQAWGEE